MHFILLKWTLLVAVVAAATVMLFLVKIITTTLCELSCCKVRTFFLDSNLHIFFCGITRHQGAFSNIDSPAEGLDSNSYIEGYCNPL